jgi:hypothetical protein
VIHGRAFHVLMRLIQVRNWENFPPIVHHVRPPEAAFPCFSRGIIHDKNPQLECEFSWRARHAELIVSLLCLEVSDWLLWALGIRLSLAGTKSISIKLSIPFSDLASALTALGTSATRIHTRIEVNSILHDTGRLLVLTVIDDI